jgi:hypothetical protein
LFAGGAIPVAIGIPGIIDGLNADIDEAPVSDMRVAAFLSLCAGSYEHTIASILNFDGGL